MLALVKDLGVYLTDPTGPVRARACDVILVAVETRLRGSALPPKQAWTLLTFFCGRVEDLPSIKPALRALTFMIQQHYATLKQHAVQEALPCGPAVLVFRALMQHVRAQAMDASLRLLAYQLMACIVEGGPAEELAQGQLALEFVGGFIGQMDGEKDPRALLAALHVAAAVQERFPEAVAPLADALFDVTSCYFPIAFTPHPDDPHGITRDILVAALNRALIASHHCADMLVPLLLEKLSSTLASAKKDALATLALAADRYGIVSPPAVAGVPLSQPAAKRARPGMGSDPAAEPEGLFDHLPMLQAALSNELEHCQDESVEPALHHALTRVAAAVSAFTDSAHPSAGTAWQSFVVPFLQTCRGELQKAPDSLAGRRSIQVLVALARSGPRCAAEVYNAACPVLLSAARDSPTAITTTACLKGMTDLAKSVNPHFAFGSEGHPMSAFAPGMLALMLGTLRSDAAVRGKLSGSIPPPAPIPAQSASAAAAFASPGGVSGSARLPAQPPSTVGVGGAVAERRGTAATGLTYLIARPPVPLVPDEDVTSIIDTLQHCVLHDQDASVRHVCLACLAALGARPALLQCLVESVIPSILGEVEIGFTGPTCEGLRVVRALHALTHLSCLPQVAEHVAPALLAMCMDPSWHLQRSRTNFSSETLAPCLLPGSATCSTDASPTTLATALLHCAATSAHRCGQMGVVDHICMGSTDGKRGLIPIVVELVLVGPRNQPLLHTVTKNALHQLLLKCSPESACKVSQCAARILFGAGEAPSLPCGPCTTGALAGKQAAQLQPRVLLLALQGRQEKATSMLCTPAATLPVIESLLNLILGSSDRDPAAVHALACCVNFGSDAAVLRAEGGAIAELTTAAVGRVVAGGTASSAGGSMSLSEAQRAVEAFTWVCKALASAGHKAAVSMTQQLLQWVTGPKLHLAEAAAEALGLLVCDTPVLSQSRGAVVRQLYKQKLFSLIMRHLTPLLPKVSSGTSPADTPLPVQLAVCCILPELPSSSMATTFSSLQPLLLHALCPSGKLQLPPRLPYSPAAVPAAPPCPSASHRLQSAAVAVFHTVLRLQPSLVEGCVSTLLPRLLHLANPEQSPFPAVRALALGSIASCAALSHSSVFPLRAVVLAALSACLDDPHRALRRHAVKARNAWFHLH